MRGEQQEKHLKSATLVSTTCAWLPNTYTRKQTCTQLFEHLIEGSVSDVVVGRCPRRGSVFWGSPQETLRVHLRSRVVLQAAGVVVHSQSLLKHTLRLRVSSRLVEPHLNQAPRDQGGGLFIQMKLLTQCI